MNRSHKTLAWTLVLMLSLISAGSASLQAVVGVRQADPPPSLQTAPIVSGEGDLRNELLVQLAFEQLKLELRSIVSVRDDVVCFLTFPGAPGQMSYREGDIIGGFRLAAIEVDSVAFEKHGVRRWLLLGETSAGERRAEPEVDAEPLDDLDEELDADPGPADESGVREDATDHKTRSQRLKSYTHRFKSAVLIEDGSNTPFRSARDRRLIANAGPRFVKPMSGRVTSRFGYRRHPMGGQRSYHRGVDLAAPHGTPIVAAADGVVTRVRYTPLMGKYIRIKHDSGYETVYGHLHEQLVKVGQNVRQGQVIGREGNTGRSTGPHLHFEIRKNGSPINPESYLEFR